MKYKYHNIISPLPNCPPNNCYSTEIDAFRFVHADIEHKNNFLPGIIINPSRINDQSDKFICSHCGLSFFSSIEQAKAKYSKLRKFNKKIAEIIGTHIAQGKLDLADGLITPPNGEGHFDLHEFESTNLQTKFVIICET